MGGGHQQHAAAAQFLNDGNSQCSALSGVGAGTQLVQQHQRMRHGKLQDSGDLFHVAGEGGKALLNALLVADVYQKFVKYADLAALIGRDQKAALRHSTQQTGGFQGNGLAAGVRAGDNKRVIFPAQCNIYRHALFRVDQRMPRTDQRERIVCTHSRLKGLEIQRQTRFCQQNVNFQHGLIAVLELRLNGGHLCSECHQYAFDLLRFLCAVLQNAGICFHDGLRLHKDSGSGGRYVVDNAAHFAAIFALDRHNIPAIAHGYHALLQIFGGIHVAHHAFQPITDAVFRGTNLLAQVIQRMGSRVCHGIRCQNGAGDLLFQTRLRCQCIEQIICRQSIMLRCSIPA